jgi:hypothetical protein
MRIIAIVLFHVSIFHIFFKPYFLIFVKIVKSKFNTLTIIENLFPLFEYWSTFFMLHATVAAYGYKNVPKNQPFLHHWSFVFDNAGRPTERRTTPMSVRRRLYYVRALSSLFANRLFPPSKMTPTNDSIKRLVLRSVGSFFHPESYNVQILHKSIGRLADCYLLE